MSDVERLVMEHSRVENGFFDRALRPVIAETVGVCLFVFVGCMSVQSNQLVSIALAHGLTIALLITGLGKYSGGHFNPAVTLGVMLSGAIAPMLAIGYVVGQLLGGMVGAAFVRATLPSVVYSQISGGCHRLGPGVEPGWAILVEIILTTVLVFTVLMAAVNTKTQSKLAPLAIGFAVAVDIMAGGPVTGASMNPARALGPAVAAAGSGIVQGAFQYHYVYWVGPLLGSMVAALLYRFFFAPPSQRWIARRDTGAGSMTKDDTPSKQEVYTIT